jgi:hypothetical protein
VSIDIKFVVLVVKAILRTVEVLHHTDCGFHMLVFFIEMSRSASVYTLI